MIVWLFAISAFSLFSTGCGNDNSSASFPPNTFTGGTSSTTGTSSTGTTTGTQVQVPVKLAFVTQPVQAQTKAGEAQAGTVLPTIQVAIEDAQGNVVTTATNPVTISLGNNPGGAQLLGTTTVNAVNGIATFSDLRISKSGSGYTLVASSPGLQGATTQSFTILPLAVGFKARLDSSTTFDVPFSESEGGWPRGIVVGDVNGDGIADAIVTPYSGPCERIMLGKGDGTFAAGTNSPPMATEADQTSIGPVLVGDATHPDLNGDGHPDLLVPNAKAKEVYVFLGHGDGTFQAGQNFATGTAGIAVGDFNNDGIVDFATTSYSNSVSLFLGKGDGTFTASGPVSVTGAGDLSRMVTGDFNNDGVADVAAVSYSGSRVFVLLGNTAQTGGTFVSQFNTGLNFEPDAIALANLNNNNTPDLLVGGQDTVEPMLDLGLASNGAVTFTPGTNVSGFDFVEAISVGDLTGDGKQDAVVAEFGPSKTPLVPNVLHVLVGHGDGTFTAAQNLATQSGYEQHATPQIADLNGDGHLDIAISSYTGFDVEAWINAGNGNFGVAPQTPEPGAPSITTQLSMLDVNGDGKLDTVFATNGDIVVQLGNGDGTWQQPQALPLANVTTVVPIDLNGDSHVDLLAATDAKLSHQLFVLTGNSDGTFGGPQLVGTLPSVPGLTQLVTGDVDGDGKIDVVANTYSYSGGSKGACALLLGHGDGTFGAATNLFFGISNECLALADVTGDGKLDLLRADFGELQLMVGRGDGTFQSASNLASTGVNDGIVSIAVADLNNDGKPDVIFAGGYSSYGAVTTLLGHGDGTFDAPVRTHFGHLLAQFNYNTPPIPTGMVTADLNNDGNLDVVVTSWYNNVWVATGNGDGTFNVLYGFGDPGDPGPAAVGDLDNDGKPDMVVLDTNKASMTTFIHQ
jgi:hypothetical protein